MVPTMSQTPKLDYCPNFCNLSPRFPQPWASRCFFRQWSHAPTKPIIYKMLPSYIPQKTIETTSAFWYPQQSNLCYFCLRFVHYHSAPNPASASNSSTPQLTQKPIFEISMLFLRYHPLTSSPYFLALLQESITSDNLSKNLQPSAYATLFSY